jgi:hypothetical protein
MLIPQMPAGFVSAPRDQVLDLAHSYLEDVFKDRYLDDEDEALRALPVPLSDYWVLQWLDYEVVQGGLATYFMNSHGRQARFAADALRRCGAEDVAKCLEEASSVVSRHEAAWEERNRDLDAAGEHAIVQPFQDLEGIEELQSVAERFEHLWLDEKPDWRELMDESLERFRRELAKTELP